VPATAADRHAGHGDVGEGKAKAAVRDRNHDRIPDRWERRHGLSLEVSQLKRDQDRDGVRNRAEYLARTDPRDADTDDDGVRDGREGAGRITAFAGGRLSVRLFNGDEVTARVDAQTSIECHPAAELEREAAHDHSGDETSGDEITRDDPEDERYTDDTGDEADEHRCSDAALKPGRVVREGEMRATAAGLAWRELELVR
jgi:hypothetical protein